MSRTMTVMTGLLVSLPAAAFAQDAEEVGATPPPGQVTAASVASGAYLPFTEGARVDAQRAFAVGIGGYDQARKTGIMESTAQVTLLGPIAISCCA